MNEHYHGERELRPEHQGLPRMRATYCYPGFPAGHGAGATVVQVSEEWLVANFDEDMPPAEDSEDGETAGLWYTFRRGAFRLDEPGKVREEDLVELLHDVTAALDNVLIHLGHHMSPTDAVTRRATVERAQQVLNKLRQETPRNGLETNSVAALRRQLKHYEEENIHLAEQVIKYRDRCDKARQLFKKVDTYFYDIRDALFGPEASSD